MGVKQIFISLFLVAPYISTSTLCLFTHLPNTLYSIMLAIDNVVK